MYTGDNNEVQEGSNCSNIEALTRLQAVDTIIKGLYTMPNLKEIFDSLPLTKSNKFPLNKDTVLYRPNIKDTISTAHSDYFSQTEVVLLLTTYTMYRVSNNPDIIRKAIGNSLDKKSFKDLLDELEGRIAQIVLSDNKSLYNRVGKVENIVDEKGYFHRPEETKRKTYIKEALTPGTSYLDAKGVEWLYLGYVNYKQTFPIVKRVRYTDANQRMQYKYEDIFDGSENVYIAENESYIKVTDKLKKSIASGKNLCDILEELARKSISKGDPAIRSLSTSKKMVSICNTYFNQSSIGLDKVITILDGENFPNNYYCKHELFISQKLVNYKEYQYQKRNHPENEDNIIKIIKQ
jgi:hypothetical protein